MTDAKSLKESIEQYEIQLSQVNMTLSTTPTDSNRNNLLNLKSDIEELIFLTKESLQNLEEDIKNKHDNTDNKKEDLLDKEYALFKAELENSSDDSEDKQDDITIAASDSIEEELKELEGMKCKAPHGNTWGGVSYHNAMICSVYRDSDEVIKDIHDIKVRVLFLNPTHKKMMPCPYFLDGSCKFSDDSCHYCHGEIVPFSNLQEYKEPDFHNIKVGSKVLTKQNNIWYRSIVLKLPEKDEDEYRVKFESSGKIVETALQDLLPLDNTNLMSDTSDDSNDDEDINKINDSESCINEQLIHKSLLTLQSSEPLGHWEKHTRGIGSKLMMQMGYVVGTGLGKLSDGRIEPVEAQVLPAGKSLDHCMELRVFAGNDKDLFSAERKMRKQQQKLKRQTEKQYQREKRKEDSNVFNFINKTLGDKVKEDTTVSQNKDRFRTESDRNLNVANFQIGENINRLEKESSKLKESLAKYTKGSVLYNNIVIKYNEKQKELANLRASEKSIVIEQNQRKNKAKLSVF